MKAIEIIRPGGPEVLRPVERPVPEPGSGEVLIRVAAAGVNRPDIMQRRGLYPPPPGASDIPGLEVAGIVVDVGSGVTGWMPGDHVCALLTGGGYAEYCVAHASLCLPIPKGLDFIQAAAIPETYFTVWDNVFERGGLRCGERFLVHGGAGGIGTTAIQLAKVLRRAEIYTTCGSDGKCRFCQRLGADVTINYRREDFADMINQMTGGEGVNLILDIIGGPYLQKNLRSLAVGGRLIIIAVQGGPRAEINLLPVFLKRLVITGSTLRPRPVPEKASIASQLLKHVWPLLETGRVHPVVHATLPLAQAAEAHRLLEKGEVVGKIVLIP